MSKVEMAEQIAQQLPATRNLHESLSRAEELAIRRKHSVVGLDHLLLALGQDPDAVAILLACNVDVEALCMDLLRKIGPEARMTSPNAVPPTFDVIVQNLIAHASAAAQKSGQMEIGSANILSAIISGEGGMITHKILQRHGLTFDEAINTLKRVMPADRPAERPAQTPTAHQPVAHPENQPVPQNKPEQHRQPNPQPNPQANSQPNQQPNPQPEQSNAQNKRPENRSENRSENNQDTTTRHLNADLKKDDVLKANSPDLTDNILEDTIVQAEAHPSDYGVAEDGSEDHPVPPQHRNIDLSNQPANHNPASNQGPNIVMKTGPKFTNPNLTGAHNPAHQQPGHPQPPHAQQNIMPQFPAQQPPHRQNPQPDSRSDHPSESQPLNNQQETQPGKPGSRINFGTSSFSPVPFNPPHSRQQGPAENDPRNDKEFNQRTEQDTQAKQSNNQGLPPIPPHNAAQIGAPLNGAPVPGTPAPFPYHQQAPHQPLPPLPKNQAQKPPHNHSMPPQGQHANPTFLQNKQNADSANQPQKNAPPINQETVDELAISIKRSQTNLAAIDSQDQVIENIPKVMRVGKMHYVEVRVARFTSAELDFGSENYGLRAKSDKGPVTKAITVRLTGPDGQFLIDSSTASTQWTQMQSGMVDDVDFAVWRWRVMPRRKGISKLRLDVTVRSSSENGITAEIPVQPSKSFEIKVTRNYARIFKSFFSLVVIFALGYGISQYGHQAYQWTMEKIEQIQKPSPDE